MRCGLVFFEPDLEIAVKTIIVRQSDQGIYSFDIHASKKYNGVLLDDLPLCGKTHVVAGGFEHKLYFTADRFHHSGFDGDDVG